MSRFARILQPETKQRPRALLVDGRMRTIAQLRSDYTTLDMGRLFGNSETGDYARSDTAYTYKVGATVYITVNARASFAAEIPVYVTDGNGKILTGSPAQAFIDDSSKLLWRAVASYLIWGKFYFRKHRNDYAYPTRLQWLSPLDVDPQIDAAAQTIKYYRVRSGRGYDMVAPQDMIAETSFNPTSDVDGVSPVEVAFTRSNIETNIGKFGDAFFRNGARPDLVVNFEGELDKEQQERARTYWQSIFQGAKNAFRAAIVGGGKWTITPVNANPVDLAMVDLSTQADMKICAILSVHPALVGLADVTDQLSASSTYDSIRQRQIQFTAIPDVRMICDALNRQWLHRDFANAPANWTLEPDVDMLTADALGTADRVTTAGAAVNNRVWSVNEARAYTGKAPLEGHVDRNPDWAVNVYNAGGLLLSEFRKAIGVMEPLPVDGLVWQIDPRQKGQQAPVSPFGVSSMPSLPQNAPTPLLEAKNDTLTVEPVPPKRSADTAAQLYELNLWRTKVKKHGYDVRFNAELLPGEIVTYVRANLDERWQPSLVFDSAKDAIRAGVQPAALGASAEDAESYWRAYDELKADLGAAWADYQRSIAPALTPDGIPDAVFDEHHESLLSAWVGTPDAPGYLTKLLIAGEAAGDMMLQRAKGIAPGNTRALALEVNWALVNQQALDFARSYAYTLIKGIDITTRDEVAAVIQRGMSEGMSRDAIADLLKETVSLDRIATRAQAIAQTESVRAYNEGSFNRWQQAGVTEAEWQTVRDTHVCPRCNSVHGVRANINTGWRSAVDGATLRPPRHPSCRCYTRPIVE